MEVPARIVRRRPRLGLCCRSAATIAAFSAPLGGALKAAETRLRVDTGGGILRLHRQEPARTLFRRPAQIHQLAPDPFVQRVIPRQLVRSPAPPCRSSYTPRSLRAVTGILQPPARQFPPDRARSTAQRLADRMQTAAPPVFGPYYATVLAAEMLVSSVHRNIPCPPGLGCCT